MSSPRHLNALHHDVAVVCITSGPIVCLSEKEFDVAVGNNALAWALPALQAINYADLEEQSKQEGIYF